MAEEQGQSKSEAPSQRRRDEAREQGQVAVSPELAGALLFFAAALTLFLGSSGLGLGLLHSVRIGLNNCSRRDLDFADTQRLLGWVMSQAISLIGPLLGLLFVVALFAMLFQVGFHFLPGLVGFRPERLLPTAGLARIFSWEGALRGLSAVLKVTALCIVSYSVCRWRWREVTALDRLDLITAVGVGWAVTARLMVTTAIAMLVLGVADYTIRRYRHEQSLRMTKQELIEEQRREEGDPQIKARIRKLARELSQRRMMQGVPRATVVITNPTHLAIALRYDRDADSAPSVVAKGAGHVAKRIIDLARRHAVPVVERKPVARALFKAVKVGQQIPLPLYQAVAEVLAYIYKLRGTPKVDGRQLG